MTESSIYSAVCGDWSKSDFYPAGLRRDTTNRPRPGSRVIGASSWGGR